MNNKKLFSGLFTAAIATSAVLGSTSMAEAGPGARFTCLSRDGIPATVALTQRGPVPVINWRSTLGGGIYTPQVRCDIVSKRFQEYYENGSLNFLTTGIKNRLPIVCVARVRGGACQDQLFTLKPGSNPGQTLRRLMAVRVGAGGPLNESASRPYFSMDELLENAPVDSSIQVPEELAIQPTPESNNILEDASSTSSETPPDLESIRETGVSDGAQKEDNSSGGSLW